MNERGPLLQLIPKALSQPQKVLLPTQSSPPLHTLLRESTTRTEFDPKKQLSKGNPLTMLSFRKTE
jgi:hypothetical protein